MEITHPEIVRRLLAAAAAAQKEGARLFFVDGAVIVGSAFERCCHAIVLVTAPEEDCLRRICARDGLTPEEAQAAWRPSCPRSSCGRPQTRRSETTAERPRCFLRAAAVLEHFERRCIGGKKRNADGWFGCCCWPFWPR